MFTLITFTWLCVHVYSCHFWYVTTFEAGISQKKDITSATCNNKVHRYLIVGHCWHPLKCSYYYKNKVQLFHITYSIISIVLIIRASTDLVTYKVLLVTEMEVIRTSCWAWRAPENMHAILFNLQALMSPVKRSFSNWILDSKSFMQTIYKLFPLWQYWTFPPNATMQSSRQLVL